MKKSLIYALSLPLLMALLSGCVLNNGKTPGGNKDPEDPSGEPSGDDPSGDPSGDDPSGDPSGGDPSGDPTGPVKDVKTYLVLGPTGLYKGNKGNDIAEKFLENAIEWTADSGTDLPGKDDVTSTVEGSIFQSWLCYENTGAPTKYSTVPTTQGLILYASFEGGNAGTAGDNPGGGGDPVINDQYGFKFENGTELKGTKIDDFIDGEGRKFEQYYVAAHEYKVGDKFQIYDFKNNAGWLIDLDPWSLGATEDNLNVWPNYLSKGDEYYEVVLDFKADAYIKLLYQNDQLYMGLVK